MAEHGAVGAVGASQPPDDESVGQRPHPSRDWGSLSTKPGFLPWLLVHLLFSGRNQRE